MGAGFAQEASTAETHTVNAVRTFHLFVQQNPNDTTPIQNLTKEDLSGDLLYSEILGYFASVDASDQLAARSAGHIVAYRLPSYGAFEASVNVSYWYGIARNVSFPGVMMDVDRLFYQVEAKDDDKLKLLAYMRQAGAAGSAFEHAVPERLFADPTKLLNDPSQPQEKWLRKSEQRTKWKLRA